MARKPRVHAPGCFYHVILRGNAGQAVFADDADRERFCALAAEGVERYLHRVHAFCLMGNHVHLVVRVADEPLSRIVHNLSFRYTRHFNRRHARFGHVFQGRFRAIVVDADSYLLELVRYVHLNPVRAGLVPDPAAYRWSGHRAYLGLDTVPWLDTDWVLSRLATRRSVAMKRYAGFILEGLGEAHREEFDHGGEVRDVLGDERFATSLGPASAVAESPRPSLEAIEAAVCRALGISAAELVEPVARRRPAGARALVGLLAVEHRAATLTAVARRYGRDVATMSELVRRAQLRAAGNPELADRLSRLREEVSRTPGD